MSDVKKVLHKIEKFAHRAWLELWEEIYPELKQLPGVIVKLIAEAEEETDWSGEGKFDYVKKGVLGWLKKEKANVPGWLLHVAIDLAVAKARVSQASGGEG